MYKVKTGEHSPRARHFPAAKAARALAAVTFLLAAIQAAPAIGKGSVLLDVGMSFGAKTGLLLGIKYFTADDLAVGVDLVGAPGGFGFGIEPDITYYPPVLNGIAYVTGGLSFMYTMQQRLEGDVFVPVSTSILALNAAAGVDTGTFWMPPVIQSDNKNNLPTVAYLEVGFSRILFASLKDGESVSALVLQGQYGDWFFPNIEAGFRQGSPGSLPSP
jgi:hypothetical protein